MKTLIVGVGALGGLIAARMASGGAEACLVTRDAESAARLRERGLRALGVGGEAAVASPRVGVLEEYEGESFDLIVLATKALDAIEAAPRVIDRLARGGTMLPIQNGGAPTMLAERFGSDRVLGGLSNLGATMIEPGLYEQRNAGHLLIGEVDGGASDRAERVRAWLERGVDTRVTAEFRGAVWSKLLLNCSITTIGAIAGCTMREYIGTPAGRAIFDRAYDEALAVALASGTRPVRMLVEPVPPGWDDRTRRSAPGEAHEAWLNEILRHYGDLKASMLQDFERGRKTEIDFINGYVAQLGRELNVPVPVNAALTETVRRIETGKWKPNPALPERILSSCDGES